MIKLKTEDPIGKGWHRECYQHPEDNNLCIKVVVNGNHKETEREQAYYRLLQKRLTDWQGLPRFHGNVETDMGWGAVFDLIRDHDGQVAKTLDHYLSDTILLEQYSQAIIEALKALKAYQVQHNVLSMSLKPKNLLFQRMNENNGRVLIIDNIGNADLIPFCSYLSFLGKKKIARKWNRFKQLLNKTYPESTAIFEKI
ncbi:YrbL family protein [Methylophaga sp. OBS4]|uniref:YrbL family protein n=1 Tax=Methylophaga sp. OBS4 TaxID=2991935 RepID=UPI00224F2957|nr:YrbL family protein [Methylophaga sp. OBS4]MCX4187625.1 YrbL family protein [Methylophaga sp. OBS4]